MELYAEDIKLKPTAREEGLFSLSVDGISLRSGISRGSSLKASLRRSSR